MSLKQRVRYRVRLLRKRPTTEQSNSGCFSWIWCRYSVISYKVKGLEIGSFTWNQFGKCCRTLLRQDTIGILITPTSTCRRCSVLKQMIRFHPVSVKDTMPFAALRDIGPACPLIEILNWCSCAVWKVVLVLFMDEDSLKANEQSGYCQYQFCHAETIRGRICQKWARQGCNQGTTETDVDDTFDLFKTLKQLNPS